MSSPERTSCYASSFARKINLDKAKNQVRHTKSQKRTAAGAGNPIPTPAAAPSEKEKSLSDRLEVPVDVFGRLHPVGNENVGVAAFLAAGVAVGGEDEPGA